MMFSVDFIIQDAKPMNYKSKATKTHDMKIFHEHFTVHFTATIYHQNIQNI